jgi:RimJ/RimL family protein N-acetyltransferase
MESTLRIRRAAQGDAAALVRILTGIAAEGKFTAITEPWPEETQRRYLESLSAREAVHVAVDESGEVIGYQTLDLWAPTIESMGHVGQVGTFLAPDWRRRGVGQALFRTTLDFARDRGYGKFVIQVRASNAGAQGFYARLGFRECGRLTSQVRIDGREEDELLMEHFL